MLLKINGNNFLVAFPGCLRKIQMLEGVTFHKFLRLKSSVYNQSPVLPLRKPFPALQNLLSKANVGSEGSLWSTVHNCFLISFVIPALLYRFMS